MSENFKKQLQYVINQKAEEMHDRYYHPEYSATEVTADLAKKQFNEGCEFLMPLIEKLTEQRDGYAKNYHAVLNLHSDTHQAILSENNKMILNLIKEGRK